MIRDRTAIHPELVTGSILLMEMGLLIQFLLGMSTNLFVRLPLIAPSLGIGSWMGSMGTMMSQSARSPLFMGHMVFGILLTIGAILTVILAALNSRATATVWGSLGLASILVAGYSGLGYFFGGHHHGDSFTMAVGWLVASIAYGMALRESGI